jgi:tetratricopeptide (TPR) repeat protein
MEEWDKALELHRMRFQEKPVNFIVYWNTIDMYMVKGMYDIARQVLMSALNDYPDNSDFFEKLALVYACQGEYDLALEEVEKAISLSRNIEPFALKGDIFYLKGDFSEAENAYRKFGLGAGIFFAYINLSQGKLEELRNLLNQAPQTMQAQLAHLFLKTGEFEKALKGFDKALEDALKNERVSEQIRMMHQKGLAYLGMKSISDAQRTANELKTLIEDSLFEKAIRYYQHLMGRIELEQENYSKAIKYFKEAISLLPYTRDGRMHFRPLFLNSLAQAYYKADDLEKAREEYEKISSLTYPRLMDGDIYAKSFYMTGKIYEQQRNRGKAIENYDKFLDLWKDADPGIAEIKDAKKKLEALK